MKIRQLERRDLDNLRNLDDGVYFFQDPENEFGSWNLMSHYLCIHNGDFAWSIDFTESRVITHCYDGISNNPFLCEKDFFIKYISENFPNYLDWILFNIEIL